MEQIDVKVNTAWVRRANSPWMLLITTLTGVSITFTPLALFELGRAGANFYNPLVWICFAVIYLVPGFYMRLAVHVLNQLREHKGRQAGADQPIDSAGA